MSDTTWFMDIESKVFSIIKAKTRPSLVTSYENINYTTNSDAVEPITVFPTVYIHELEPSPIGNGISDSLVNGIMSTFEVKVTVNTQKSDAKKIMKSIVEAFIDLDFYTPSLPITVGEANMFISTARFRRAIGVNDKF